MYECMYLCVCVYIYIYEHRLFEWARRVRGAVSHLMGGGAVWPQCELCVCCEPFVVWAVSGG